MTGSNNDVAENIAIDLDGGNVSIIYSSGTITLTKTMSLSDVGDFIRRLRGAADAIVNGIGASGSRPGGSCLVRREDLGWLLNEFRKSGYRAAHAGEMARLEDALRATEEGTP